jgi:hypothetical protein
MKILRYPLSVILMLPILSSTLVIAEDGLPYLFTYPDEVIYIGVEPCEYNNTLFTIEVVVANVTDCQGVDFWLTYNSTLLSKEGSADFDGPFASGNPPISDWGMGGDSSVPGTVKVSWAWTVDPPFNGTGTVCAITFKIIYCPPQNNTVSCDLAFYELTTKIWDPQGVPQPRDPSVNGYYEYTTIYPSSVGGIRVPVDKLGLLAPYLALVATMILAVSISVAIIKYRKKQ